MKKVTLLSGLVSSIIFFIGFMMKIMHLPGTGFALFAGVILFALVYSPLLFMERNRLTRDGFQRFVHSAGMITMSIVACSFLFKVMHWPGAGILLISANVLLVAMIPILLIRASRENEPVRRLNFYHEAIIIMILLPALQLFLWMMMK